MRTMSATEYLEQARAEVQRKRPDFFNVNNGGDYESAREITGDRQFAFCFRVRLPVLRNSKRVERNTGTETGGPSWLPVFKLRRMVNSAVCANSAKGKNQ